MNSADRIVVAFDAVRNLAASLGEEAHTYYWYNRKRLIALTRLVSDALARNPGESDRRVLDVGAGFQTIVFQKLWPDVHVDTLGLPDPKFYPRPPGVAYDLDLNAPGLTERAPAIAQYDLIVCAEVVEHLYTSPQPAVNFLASHLRPGGQLLLTTPNGAGLQHRLRLIMGRNPYALLLEELTNPSHFREYTLDEVIAMGHRAGLDLVEIRTGHWTTTGSALSRIFSALSPVLPKRLRKDMMLVFSRPRDLA